MKSRGKKLLIASIALLLLISCSRRSEPLFNIVNFGVRGNVTAINTGPIENIVLKNIYADPSGSCPDTPSIMLSNSMNPYIGMVKTMKNRTPCRLIDVKQQNLNNLNK